MLVARFNCHLRPGGDGRQARTLATIPLDLSVTGLTKRSKGRTPLPRKSSGAPESGNYLISMILHVAKILSGSGRSTLRPLDLLAF